MVLPFAERIVFSAEELSTGVSRPIEAPGYIPPTDSPDPFPFKIVLTGLTEPMPRNYEADTEILSIPQAVADGGIIFNIWPYATCTEALAVGNAFPHHPIYETWREKELEYYQSCATEQRLPDVARVALTAIYLYAPREAVDEILEQPAAEERRFELHDDSSKFARYVFARGIPEQPLIEVSYQPDVMPSDLPPLDYKALEQLLQEYEIFMAGKSPVLDTGQTRQVMQEMQLEEATQTATIAQLRLAYRMALVVGKDLVGHTAPEQELNVKQLEILNRLFAGSYVDVAGSYPIDGSEK